MDRAAAAKRIPRAQGSIVFSAAPIFLGAVTDQCTNREIDCVILLKIRTPHLLVVAGEFAGNLEAGCCLLGFPGD